MGWLIWGVGGGALLALLLAVFVVLPDLVRPPPIDPVRQPVTAPGAEQPALQPQRQEDTQPAPFAALQRQQAREKAQAELAEFVELQLELEETMQVGVWGQEQFDAAKALATEGDEQFLEEEFEAALASYDAAGHALASLIGTGQALLEEALAAGQAALTAKEQQQADAQFTAALTIDPDNAEAQRGLARAALLPEVLLLMRQGKNQELAGRWQEAVGSYEQVAALDPDTSGLDAALAAAREGVRQARIRDHLSEAFAALDAERFDVARRAFNAALALDQSNSVARGGLEQVAARTDVSEIEQLKASAARAERDERWQQALADYERVLSLDANIQFAKDGKSRATEQYRTSTALGNIINSPDKLSSPQLFDQAKEILARAERLEPRGETLAAQIVDVSELIRTYSTPVQVTFKSDNATRITLSTVGVLGAFDEKQLTLRPGAYTVIGSRDGCRDIRESILVRPNMQPVDIRCTETF